MGPASLTLMARPNSCSLPARVTPGPGDVPLARTAREATAEYRWRVVAEAMRVKLVAQVDIADEIAWVGKQ